MKIKEGMELDYASFRENNTKDGYSAGIIRYAERWCGMMELEMENGATVAEAAERTNHTADTEGITGYMYGCAVQSLCQFWEHGEELRQWHNQQYGYSGDGIVNPAIIHVEGNTFDGDQEDFTDDESQAPTVQM